ncbi:hypothetical protein D3C77_664120 [compost metagenome]
MRQRLTLLDGLANLTLGGRGIDITGQTPLAGVSPIELVHQQIETLQVVTHAQGGHAVYAGLKQLLGRALTELGGNIAPLLLTATTGTTCQQRKQ